MRTQELFNFMYERHQIYLRRLAGEAKPWTLDPILQRYRFTCAYRELDKVTVWIRENWRDPHRDDPDVWFAMCVARYINWPDTLARITPLPFNAKKVCTTMNKMAGKQVVRKMMAKSNKGAQHKIERVQTTYSQQIFGGAYFLNSIGSKIESIVNDRLDPLWQCRTTITADLKRQTTLAGAYEVLRAQHGFGSFMAAQVVADIKYTPQFNEAKMTDWWTWAASGPGSKRGLNRLTGRPVNASWNEREWHDTLLVLRENLLPLLKKADMPAMHAQDVQGIGCCEWDKHERVRLGEGRPKAKYPGI